MHWKEKACQCAVIGCTRRRKPGWSTCTLWNHYPAGRSLYGAGRIAPIDPARLPGERELSLLPDYCPTCGVERYDGEFPHRSTCADGAPG